MEQQVSFRFLDKDGRRTVELDGKDITASVVSFEFYARNFGPHTVRLQLQVSDAELESEVVTR